MKRLRADIAKINVIIFLCIVKALQSFFEVRHLRRFLFSGAFTLEFDVWVGVIGVFQKVCQRVVTVWCHIRKMSSIAVVVVHELSQTHDDDLRSARAACGRRTS